MFLEGVWNLPEDEREQILNGPALSPPEGVIPNFSHPENHNASGLSALAICFTFASLIVPLRVYSKVFCSRKVFFEDGKVPVT